MHDGISLGLVAVVSVFAVLGATPFADWHSLVTDFGFPIALVMFFVWNSWKREERMGTRVTNLETFVQTELMDINKQAVQAISDNTAALNRLITTLDTRPCLCEAENVVEKLDILVSRVDKLGDQKP